MTDETKQILGGIWTLIGLVACFVGMTYVIVMAHRGRFAEATYGLGLIILWFVVRIAQESYEKHQR